LAEVMVLVSPGRVAVGYRQEEAPEGERGPWAPALPRQLTAGRDLWLRAAG